jgi:tRNA nucleotidyltransferase (CCA-adding enzyme)
MQDVLTGEILDPYGGLKDIKARVLRCVDPESFVEDPLRVLRCARFAAALDFAVDPDTVKLCSSMDISTLSRERVEGELKKVLTGTEKPSVFFGVLRQMDQLETWFPELKQLIDLEQDPVYHPEGDVWTHTMEVLDRAAALRDKAELPYAFMLLALTHDFGKIVTTEFVNGRIHAYGHEAAGLPIIEGFLRRFTEETAVIGYVLNMAELHMKPNMMAFSKSAVKTTNKMFDSAASAQDLILMAAADHPVQSGDTPFSGDVDFLAERLKTYQETMAKPYVMGRDLIEAGLKPGENFGELLEYAHKLRLAGIDKETALKQVLAMARKKQ